MSSKTVSVKSVSVGGESTHRHIARCVNPLEDIILTTIEDITSGLDPVLDIEIPAEGVLIEHDTHYPQFWEQGRYVLRNQEIFNPIIGLNIAQED